MKAFLFAISVIVLSACGNHDISVVYKAEPLDTTEVKKIIISEYCGECYIRCADVFILDKNSVTIDTSKYAYFMRYENNNTNHPQVPPITIQGEGVGMHYLNMSKLYPKGRAFKSARYGKPDNADQCGVYVAFITDEETIEWRIDTKNENEGELLPNDIIQFRDKVYKEMNLLHKNYLDK